MTDTVLLQFIEKLSNICADISTQYSLLLDVWGEVNSEGVVVKDGLYQNRFQEKIEALTDEDMQGTGIDHAQYLIDLCEAMPLFNHQVSEMNLKTIVDRVKRIP